MKKEFKQEELSDEIETKETTKQALKTIDCSNDTSLPF
jgi:hypothetical protein